MPSDETPRPARRGVVETLVELIVRRPRWVLLLAVVPIALAAWRVRRLDLRTDMVELLAQKSPAVKVLREMDRRFPSLANVIVVVEGPVAESNRRFVDDLVPLLSAIPSPEIAEVDWGVKAAHDFYRKNGFLYASLAELDDAYSRLQREILRRKNPAFLDLSSDEETVPEELLDRKAASLLDRFPHDHYATADGKVYAVIVRFRGSLLGRTQGEQTVAAIRQVVDKAQPQRYHADIGVGLTGNVMSGLAERHALESDLKLATTTCTLLVGLVMLLYFRSLMLTLSSVLPAACGVLVALAIAQLAFGYLNAATAFMAAIILGNGINYAIIQTARYKEERQRGAAPARAAVTAVVRTWRATGISALAAAIAYGALVATTFRGFSQFGYIGAAGMIIAWLLTVTLLPAVWAQLDRRKDVPWTGHRLWAVRAADASVQWVLRRPKTILGVGTALTIAAIASLPHYLHDPFEYDFRRLGNQSNARREIEALSAKADQIFGRSLSPGVILLDRSSEAIQVKRAIEARDPRHAIVAKTTSVDDLLPGDAALQDAKLRVLAKIRRLIDANLGLLDENQRKKLADLRPPDDLRPIVAADLPFSLRRYFTERDGTIGRIVVYFPPDDVSVWDGKYLLRLAGVVAAIPVSDGRVARSSGVGVVFADMIRSIIHDGPVVTAVALGGVLVLLVGVAGWRREPIWVVVTLIAGVLWMVGAAAAAHVGINFLNFIALPITFGIGVDYGINLIERYRQEGMGGIRTAFVATGGAVVLCSLTTIIGYAALLLADNHALRSFGAMAILGEIACINAALWLLPALLSLRRRRQSPS